MIFRLTHKTASKLRMKLATVGVDHPSLVEWYCNVVTAQRRQFFLFTQGTTLFSFWVAVTEMRRQDFADSSAFRPKTRSGYGFADGDLAKMIDDGPDTFATSADRGVLGSMVDFANMLKHTVDHRGGLQSLSRRAMNDIANECPMSKIEMNMPAGYLRRVLQAAGAAVEDVAADPGHSVGNPSRLAVVIHHPRASATDRRYRSGARAIPPVMVPNRSGSG